jgi:hypothetical protein
MSISHPFSGGGGWRKAGLSSLRKIQLVIPILAFFQWFIWGLLSLSGQRSVFPVSTRVPPLKLSKRLSTSSTNTAVARYSLLHPPKWTQKESVGFLVYFNNNRDSAQCAKFSLYRIEITKWVFWHTLVHGIGHTYFHTIGTHIVLLWCGNFSYCISCGGSHGRRIASSGVWGCSLHASNRCHRTLTIFPSS